MLTRAGAFHKLPCPVPVLQSVICAVYEEQMYASWASLSPWSPGEVADARGGSEWSPDSESGGRLSPREDWSSLHGFLVSGVGQDARYQPFTMDGAPLSPAPLRRYNAAALFVFGFGRSASPPAFWCAVAQLPLELQDYVFRNLLRVAPEEDFPLLHLRSALCFAGVSLSFQRYSEQLHVWRSNQFPLDFWDAVADFPVEMQGCVFHYFMRLASAQDLPVLRLRAAMCCAGFSFASQREAEHRWFNVDRRGGTSSAMTEDVLSQVLTMIGNVIPYLRLRECCRHLRVTSSPRYLPRSVVFNAMQLPSAALRSCAALQQLLAQAPALELAVPQRHYDCLPSAASVVALHWEGRYVLRPRTYSAQAQICSWQARQPCHHAASIVVDLPPSDFLFASRHKRQVAR